MSINSEMIKSHRVFEGEVISDKMQKTVVVRVERTFQHPSLGKIVKRFKKFKAHDEQNSAKIGDWVEIAESRPLSKTKHMVLKRIIRKVSE